MKLIRVEVIKSFQLEHRWYINERGDYVKRIINIKKQFKNKRVGIRK